MTDEELIENLESFKSGCISQATGGNFDDKEYKRLRELLIYNNTLKPFVPNFIKVNRTPREMFRFLQADFKTYAERTTFISTEFNKLIELIENNRINDPFISINQFLNMERIGNGGFGEVYKIHNDCLNMDFAVKIYNPVFMNEEEKIDGERRFFREAKIMFSINNINVARIYDAGRYENRPFIKMEYIDGFSLFDFQKKYGCLSFEETKKVIGDILNGLYSAHNKGVVHRDLKPSNIMFSSSEKVFKIIDFGVSAFIDTIESTKLTKTGESVAGGQYIDPLIQNNPKLKDCRSDIYSVGAIWYFLLTGIAPIGSNMKDYLIENSNLEDKQVNIIMKCLSSKIDDRFENVDELLKIMDKI